MTPEEEAVVEAAVSAIRDSEYGHTKRNARGKYVGPTADGIISDWLEQQGEPRAGKRWSRLIRQATRRALGDSFGRYGAKPSSEPEHERALAFYDRYRPASARLDALDGGR